MWVSIFLQAPLSPELHLIFSPVTLRILLFHRRLQTTELETCFFFAFEWNCENKFSPGVKNNLKDSSLWAKHVVWLTLFIRITENINASLVTSCLKLCHFNLSFLCDRSTLFTMNGQWDVHWSVLWGSDVADQHTQTQLHPSKPRIQVALSSVGGTRH